MTEVEVDVFLDGICVGRARASVSADQRTCELRLDDNAEIEFSELPHGPPKVVTLRFPAGERHFEYTSIHGNMVVGVLM